MKTSRWQHVACTYDHASGWASLFVDGAVVAATNIGVLTPETSGTVVIGSGSASYFYGAVDELAVYGRALSSFEIAAIYRSANGRCTEPPVIIRHPESLRANAGTDVLLSVEVSGNPLLRYAWGIGRYSPKQSQFLKGATNESLLLTNVQAKDEGEYWVRVTNAFGAAVSSNAMLWVNYRPLADAGATPTPLILPACTNAVAAVLDGSRSSDPDADPLGYLWLTTLCTQPSAPAATGVVAVVLLPAGTHAFDLVVDDGLLTDTNRVKVEVLTPAQAVERLVATVNHSGWEKAHSLLASLDAALASIGKSNLIPAVNQLEAFQNKVRAQVTPADPGLAARFTRDARAIIEALLNCGSHPGPKRGRIVAQHAHGRPTLEFEGAEGARYIIEASTDMLHWQMIGVARHKGDGQFDFEDANADKFNCRYYRIVAP